MGKQGAHKQQHVVLATLQPAAWPSDGPATSRFIINAGADATHADLQSNTYTVPGCCQADSNSQFKTADITLYTRPTPHVSSANGSSNTAQAGTCGLLENETTGPFQCQRRGDIDQACIADLQERGMCGKTGCAGRFVMGTHLAGDWLVSSWPNVVVTERCTDMPERRVHGAPMGLRWPKWTFCDLARSCTHLPKQQPATATRHGGTQLYGMHERHSNFCSAVLCGDRVTTACLNLLSQRGPLMSTLPLSRTPLEPHGRARARERQPEKRLRPCMPT